VSFTYNSGPAVGAQITNWAFAGGPASVAANFLQVSGGATSVDVAGLASISVASFSVTRRTAVAAVDSAAGALTGSLFTVHLTGISAALGTDGATLTITGGALDLYSYKTLTAGYLLATGSDFSLSAVLGPVAITTTGVSFTSNSGPAAPAAQITNWAFAGGPASV